MILDAQLLYRPALVSYQIIYYPFFELILFVITFSVMKFSISPEIVCHIWANEAVY